VLLKIFSNLCCYLPANY